MPFPLVKDVLQAIRKVFSNPKYVSVAFAAWIFFILLFYYLAIYSVPGNDLEFFFSLSTPYELAALLATTVLMAVVATMNAKILRIHWQDMNSAGVGLGALAANLLSLMLISASCTACLIALAGAAAAPVLFLLFEYRMYAIAGSFLLLLFSLHQAARRILDKCEYCKIVHNNKHGNEKGKA